MTDPTRTELRVTCHVCGCAVLVCCYVDDVDPLVYRCLDCRHAAQDLRDRSPFQTPTVRAGRPVTRTRPARDTAKRVTGVGGAA